MTDFGARGDQTVDHFRSHLFRKRGIYYYSRRVPKALQERLNKHRVSFSLKTRSIVKARALAARVTGRLDVVWAELWLENHGIMPKDRPEKPCNKPLTEAPLPQVSKRAVRIVDANELYVRLKGYGKSPMFFTSTQRNIGYLIDCLGNIEITAIGRSEACRFRDRLIERGMTHVSINRVLSTVKAMLNMAISEYGLNCQNPFSRLFIPDVGKQTKRATISPDNIHAIQRECMVIDDGKRWLIALISDTGLRLAEAAGLQCSDVCLEGKNPHIIIQDHPWRPLKTLSSARIVPLVGAAKWAAERAIVEAKNAFLFPEYASLDVCNANSASAALNKWLGETNIARHFTKSRRSAAVHAKEGKIYSPDDPDDFAQFQRDLPLIEALAELAIEDRYGIKTARTRRRNSLPNQRSVDMPT